MTTTASRVCSPRTPTGWMATGDDEGGYVEEEQMALSTEKSNRRQAAEEELRRGGISLAKMPSATAKKVKKDVFDAEPVVEAVERDFASLSKSERLAVLKKESPEVLKMLDDLKKYLAEVKQLAQPLNELLHQRRLTSESDKNLVAFLETKVQLMLSYCMHVTFYLLLKSEGRKVAGHPVIDNLVEIRVYLEKMWPLEEKLQYSLNRLLSGKSTATAHLGDLRPVKGSESGLYEAARGSQDTEARERRRLQQQQREAEELEREELSAMTRVQSKKASALNKIALDNRIAPLSYREDEDQYFAKLTTDDKDGEGEGLSLMDALRQRQAKVASLQKPSKAVRVAEEEALEGDEEEDLDEDEAGSEEGEEGEEADYDAMLEEEVAREEAKERDTAARPAFQVKEADRRKASKKIESHRGLTKARPKDRKNPRVAQRHKYQKRLQIHKAQSRRFQPEPEEGFVGVRSVKAGVVRSTKL
ncbi:U3 small nucleolar RNA-associated protein 3 [Strigomonas culicis]|uniref:U3 small nucleolar RNA-associated protein 3 n=1 Tax=Strigomonas culicis TaxID=28005 RepID=S9UW08_9TRYP|nr:U3 small nucleolar RNA-associated protein 3 [Strigomonas culicis]|eukprot:EPY18716.1 U3 small nucleolar RNA-associated protein 3 [Strigomonas culicis]